MDKPLLLLDVDGVLNAVSGAQLPKCWPNWERFRAENGFLITYAPAVVAFLNSWIDRGEIEIRWLTTWAYEANKLIGEPLGLPELEVVGGPYDVDIDYSVNWWKLGYAKKVGGNERPLIWLDDDLRDREAQAWLDNRTGPVLPIIPSTAVGLTPEHMVDIEEFVQTWR